MSQTTLNLPVYSSVRKARLALQGHAEEHVQLLRKIINMAAAAGDFETAAKYTAWLIEHTPKQDGEAIIDESAAKAKIIDKGHSGPTIQIGVKVGGIDHQSKQLDGMVISVTDTKDEPTL